MSDDETQRQTSKRLGSKVTGRPYSALSRSVEHIELQRADDADDRRRAVMRQEHLHDAFFRHLLQRLAQLLGLHRVGELDPAQDFRGEARHAAKDDLLALGQRVADAQEPVIGNADHVAGERFLRQRAILGEEELRRRKRDRLARAHELRPHAALELARADAHEGDAVAMVRVHVRLDLEHEAGHLRLVRLHRAARGFLRARARREFGQRVDEVLDAEILERAAPQDRGQMAFEEGLLVESA